MSRKNPQLPRMKVVRRTEKKTEIEIVTEKDDVPVLRTDEGVHDQGSVVNGLDPGTGREVEVEKNHLRNSLVLERSRETSTATEGTRTAKTVPEAKRTGTKTFTLSMV